MSVNNKVMPNSLEAEQAVIASMLIDNTVAEELINSINLVDFPFSKGQAFRFSYITCRANRYG